MLPTLAVPNLKASSTVGAALHIGYSVLTMDVCSEALGF